MKKKETLDKTNVLDVEKRRSSEKWFLLGNRDTPISFNFDVLKQT